MGDCQKQSSTLGVFSKGIPPLSWEGKVEKHLKDIMGEGVSN